MKAVAVIPARMESTRLKHKVVAPIGGIPMVVRTMLQASRCQALSRVLVASDSEKVCTLVREAGGEAVLTHGDHASGTDRVAAVVADMEVDIVVNVQADEPFIEAEHIDELVSLLQINEAADVATLSVKISNLHEWHDPNVVKVLCRQHGEALYFSRTPLPFVRENSTQLPSMARRHVGLYAYRHGALQRIAKAPRSMLEVSEDLEQLRFLEMGLRLWVQEVDHVARGIDSAADLMWARAYVEQGNQEHACIG